MEESAQQGVEPDQVVDMGMRDENLTDLEYLPGCEEVQVAAVEEQGFTAMGQADIESGVAEGVVNESGIEDGSHIHLFPKSGPPGKNPESRPYEMIGWVRLFPEPIEQLFRELSARPRAADRP